MKKTLYILTLLSISISVFSQSPKVMNLPTHDDEPMHFGYSLGLNVMDIFVFPYLENGQQVEVKDLSPGFQVQAIANFRLMNNLDFRILPGLSFGERILDFGDKTFHKDSLPQSIESNYLEVPLLFKFKTNRINNFAPYLIGGANLRTDLVSIKHGIRGKQDEHPESTIFNKFNPFYEIGVGFDFYTFYFKFGVELKYSRTILNTYNADKLNGAFKPAFQGVERIDQSVFMISLHFE